MLPISPLMVEHTVIQRMVALIPKEADLMAREGNIHSEFIDGIIDFIRIFADRCHHGKEEDILFREARKKPLSKALRHVLEQLLEEHQSGRRAVRELIDGKERYARGEKDVLPTILQSLRFLSQFYPKHIAFEENDFFYPSMNYFTQEEKEALMREEQEFDRNLIHKIYEERVDQSEKKYNL